MIFDGASHDNFLILRQFWYLVVEDGDLAKKRKRNEQPLMRSLTVKLRRVTLLLEQGKFCVKAVDTFFPPLVRL